MSRTIARLSAKADATVACIIRKARKTSMLGASMQPRVAARKMPKQQSSTGRRPSAVGQGTDDELKHGGQPEVGQTASATTA